MNFVWLNPREKKEQIVTLHLLGISLLIFQYD